MTENLTGILFGLLTVLSWTLCIFPFTEAARRIGANTLNHLRLLLATVIITIVSLLLDAGAFAVLFTSAYFPSWCWLGLSGIIGLTFGDYFAFRMYAILGARVGSVLTTLAPAAALVLGGFLTNEHMSLIGILGILITIGGIANISFGKRERGLILDHGHGSISAGVIWGIGASFCQGAGLVLAKRAMMTQHENGLDIHPVNATFIRLIIAFSSLALVTLAMGQWRKVLRPAIQNQNGGLKYAIAGTIFGPFLGVCLSLFTVTHIDASVAQTIFSLVPAAALLFSGLFMKEKISFHSFAGVFIAITGVLILIWRESLAAWVGI